MSEKKEKKPPIVHDTNTPIDWNREENKLFVLIMQKLKNQVPDISEKIWPFVLFVDGKNKQLRVSMNEDKKYIYIRFSASGFDLVYQALYLYTMEKTGKEPCLPKNEEKEHVQGCLKETVSFLEDVDYNSFLFFKSNYKQTIVEYKEFLVYMYSLIKKECPEEYNFWMMTIDKRIAKLKEKFPDETDKAESENNSDSEIKNNLKWWHIALFAGIFLGLLFLVIYVIF